MKTRFVDSSSSKEISCRSSGSGIASKILNYIKKEKITLTTTIE